jgi:hypothetical protein
MLTNSQVAVSAATTADYTVQVTIEQVTALDSIDAFPLNEADFYGFITINGSTFRTPVIAGNDIQPNWNYTVQVAAGSGDIPIQIALWDDDGSFNGDDHVDIHAGDGRDLNLIVDLTSCTVGGDIGGVCESSLISSGLQDNRARIQFRIDVSTPAQSYLIYLPYPPSTEE